MDPLRNNRTKRQQRQRSTRREEFEEDYLEDEEEIEEEDYNDYRRKLANGRNQRGQVRRYLREETSFFEDIAINPCRRVVRMSCNTISYIVTFFAICFFFGVVFKISYGIYSFFV